MSRHEETEEEIVEGEAEMAKEANKSVVEEMAEFQERKEAAKETVKAFKADKSVPEGKPQKDAPIRDTAHLDAFKTKLTNDFGLVEKTDSHGCVQLKLKNKNVIKLLPRKGWYGVWRADGDKAKAFRVASQEDEDSHYAFVQEFVKSNSTEEA